MSKVIKQLFEASKNPDAMTQKQQREAQKEALDFDFYSYKDSNVEKLEAFGSHLYKRVVDEIEVSNPLDLFFDFDNGDLDTEYEQQIVSGGRVYDWAYGATRKRSPIKMEHWTILQTPRQLAYEIEVQKLKTGRLLVNDLVSEAARCILAHKVKTGINAFLASYPTSSDYSINAGDADITQTVIDTALRPLRGLGKARAIVGHATALYPLTKLLGYDANTGFPESVKEELHRKGNLGQYLGVPIVELLDYQDPYYLDTPIPSTNIWVVPEMSKNFNVYLEYGDISPETPETIQNQQLIVLYWYWEDGAGLPTKDQLLRYARRIYAASNG